MFDHEEMHSPARGGPGNAADIPRYKRILPRRILRAIAPVWVLCLIGGSLLPGSVKEELGTISHEQILHQTRRVTLKHRVVHFLAFGSTCLLLMLIAKDPLGEVLGAGFVVLLGCAIETAQYFIYPIPFEWWDVLDDLYATAAMFAAVRLANHLSRKREFGRSL